MASKNTKKIIEREIELINQSRELDKFDYNLFVSVTLSIGIIFIPILIGLIISDVEKNLSWIIGILIVYIIFIVFMYFIRLNPPRIDFQKKSKMMKIRYEKLGIDLKKLDKELDKTKLK